MKLFCSFIFFLSSPIYFSNPSAQIEYLYSFGNFSGARAISIASTGLVYVVDTGNNKLKVFTNAGDSVREIGGYGWGQLEFDRPYDVHTGTGLNIYVADYGNHRIQRFDKDLNYISTLYTRDSDDISTRFGYPTGVSLSRLGDLFVLDSENSRVLKVNTLSSIERTFGGIDAGKGRLRNPRQVNVTQRDLVCVLDGGRVVLFDNFGNYIRTIGEGVLKGPHGMTVANDTIYVVEQKQIFLFNTVGKLLQTLEPVVMDENNTDQSFSDVAIHQNRIYALTERSVVVFQWKQESP